ncbi:MAG: CARDB domain-containing protein [Thermoplasmata archaeon]
MKTLVIKKAIVFALVFSLLVGGFMLTTGNVKASVQKGTLNVAVVYHDLITGESGYVNGLNVELLDYSGNVISTQTSNPVVSFSNISIGNYILRVNPQEVGNYIYEISNVPVTITSSGANISSINVYRYPINQKVQLNITYNGMPINHTKVSAYFGSSLIFFTGYTGIMGNITFNAPPTNIMIKITNNSGGAINDYYFMVNPPYSGSVDLSTFTHYFGTVENASNGNLISQNTYVDFVSNNSLVFVIKYSSGIYNFFISGNYQMYVTSDGYSVAQIMNPGYSSIELNPVKTYYNYYYTFSNDFKYIYFNETITINNKTIFKALPFSDSDILYYQMMENNFNSLNLQQFLENSLNYYTLNMIEVNNYVYSKISSSVMPFVINYQGFTVTLSAVYYNSSINIASLNKSNGGIPITLNTSINNYYGSYNVYNYYVNIPSQYELSNNISNAQYSGYINTISIYNSKAPYVNLILKLRKSPELILSQSTINLYWNNIITDRNYIINSSSTNFTIIIPSNKNVSINVSNMPIDMVRQWYTWKQMIFNWTVDGNNVLNGVGNTNLTYIFSPGIHKLYLKVTDVGNNTNSTNIIIYSDGAYPSSNSQISVLSNSSTVISWNVYYINNTLYYIYGNSTNSISITDYKVTLPEIKVDEETQLELKATDIQDTLNGQIKSNSPTYVIWNIDGTKYSGNSITYTFGYPTRNKLDWINVTYSDQVNNSVTVSIPVFVKDILKPIPLITFLNSTGKSVSQILQNNNITLSSNGTYDPQNGTIVMYNWTIKSENKILMPGSNYTIVSGNLTSPTVTLKFTEYGTYQIILNVSDKSGNYNTTYRNLTVVPVAPDLIIDNVTWHGNFTEGSKGIFYVNVTNTGNAPASTYNVALYVNNKVVVNLTFTNLMENNTQLVKISWTPPSAGNYTLKFVAYTPEEPKMYLGDNVQTKIVPVSEAPWKLPVIISSIIIIIIVVAIVGWKFTTGKKLNQNVKQQTKK